MEKGALSLDNVSPVIIDVEEGEAVIDVGAMHARSVVEKGIVFKNERRSSKWQTILACVGNYYRE